ncbi:GtrA family protein [bacterium]|nr:MAG: GtrA family protein [bacterium]
MTIFARHSQFLRFAMVGSGCFLLNMIVLYVGKEILHLHYMLASTLTLFIVSGVGFFLNRKLTFRAQGVQIWHELRRYYTVNIGSFAFSLSLVALLVEGLSMHYLVANVLVGLAVMAGNFWLHKNWSFGKASLTRKKT